MGYCCCCSRRKKFNGETSAAATNAPTLRPPPAPATSAVNVEPFKAPDSTQASTTAPTLPPLATPATSKKPPPTMEQVQSLFEAVDIATHADVLIHAIYEILQMETARKPAQNKPSTSYQTTTTVEKPQMWVLFIQSGATFLKFVNDHADKLDNKDKFFQSGQGIKVVADILQQLGQLHWMVGVLSIVGYLVSKIQKVSDNRDECVELLKDLLQLARHIQKLGNLISEEEKLKNALHLIIEGSMSCACQLDSGKFFSFLKTSVNSETLSGLRSKVNQLYRDLTLTTTIAIKQQQSVFLPISKPTYPEKAVGLDKQLEAVKRFLNIETTKDSSSMAVVIYGFGGIGKTTLANAVVANLDIKHYMYTKIELDEFPQNNNYTKLQQQILKDVFPNYASGKQIELRNTEDGRYHLSQAFKSEANRPVFLFVDNALHVEDLKMLLPEDLKGLPQRSRFLITTRILKVTDILEDRGLPRSSYHVTTLQNEDAKKIVCNDTASLLLIKDDVERILKICQGIPLVLEIVAGRLRKQKYNADKCSQILEALEKGKQIKEDNLTKRLFDFVYKELEEPTQEAFLDICCFFNNWRRQHVEYIVGYEEVTSLEEAALITSVKLRFPGDEEEERLIVHDVIRAIGVHLSTYSRIINAQSYNEAAKDEGRMRKMKGVWIKEDDKSQPHSTHEETHLDSMKDSLRVVALKGSIDVQWRSKETFQELRFLKLDLGIRFMPLDLERLDKLAVLHLSARLLSQQTSPLLFPKKLQVMKVLQSRIELPDLSKTVQKFSLDELDLTAPTLFLDEYDLTAAQRSVNALNSFLSGFDKLRILRLDSWRTMRKLPEEVCRLLSLKKLTMSGCARLMRLQDSFGELKSLTHLDLRKCMSLQELPSTLGKLEVLEHLNLASCLNLKELPAGFEQLGALKYLNLSNCRRLESDICQKDNRLKIVKRSEHACIDCKKGNNLSITIVKEEITFHL